MQDPLPSQAEHGASRPPLQRLAAVAGGSCLPGTPFAALAPAALAGRAGTAGRNAVSRNVLQLYSFTFHLNELRALSLTICIQ